MKLSTFAKYIGVPVPQPSQETPKIEINPENLGPKEVFLAWETLGRPTKKMRNTRMTRTLTVIGIVIALLLAIMGEFFLILVIGSLIFVSYVLSNTPPEISKFEISSHGVMFDEQMYYWIQLKQFFYTNFGDSEILAIDTKEALPGRIFISFKQEDKQKLHEVISRYLPFLKQEPKSAFDKMYESVLDKFNTEG